jgi:hypothetical protein
LHGALPGQCQGGVFNHVCLSSDHSPASHFNQNASGLQAILRGCAFGEQQESTMGSCIKEDVGLQDQYKIESSL